MERLIRQRLAANEYLCGQLARGTDSIFYHKASADDNAAAYPQIIIGIDKFSDAVKGVYGTVTLDILSTQMNQPPEDIESLVRAELEGIIFAGEMPFSLKWSKTEFFTEQASERLPLIIGLTATFDLYCYPIAITPEPDVIAGLNEFGMELGAFVIGQSEFADFYEPTREQPAIYFSVEKLTLTEQKSTAVFIDALIRCHVFCADIKIRRLWLNFILEQLVMVKAIKLADGSPARVQAAEYIAEATEAAGQLRLRFNYGLRRVFMVENPIMYRRESFDGKLRRR